MVSWSSFGDGYIRYFNMWLWLWKHNIFDLFQSESLNQENMSWKEICFVTFFTDVKYCCTCPADSGKFIKMRHPLIRPQILNYVQMHHGGRLHSCGRCKAAKARLRFPWEFYICCRSRKRAGLFSGAFLLLFIIPSQTAFTICRPPRQDGSSLIAHRSEVWHGKCDGELERK